MNWKKELKDKLWYSISYAKDLKEEDTKEYVEHIADEYIDFIENILNKIIKEIEEELDNINGEKGNLCLFCGSNKYNGKVGIIHKKGCLILKLRKL